MIGDLSIFEKSKRRFERQHYIKSFWQLHRFLRRGGANDAALIRNVPTAVADGARLADASMKVLEANGSSSAAQTYLNATIRNNPWRVDSELTTRDSLVVLNELTGDVHISFRGTPIPNRISMIGATVHDVQQDIRIAAGAHDASREYADTFQTVDRAIAKYGAGRVTDVSGYSLGGNKALAVARWYPTSRRRCTTRSSGPGTCHWPWPTQAWPGV